MNVLELIEQLIDKYDELQDIAEVQLQNGYSRQWYAEMCASKAKIEVLKEMKKEVEKEPEANESIKYSLRDMYLLETSNGKIIALVDPDCVSYIENIPYGSRTLIKVQCNLSVECHNVPTVSTSVNFYCQKIVRKLVDINTIVELNSQVLVWDEDSEVCTVEELLNIADHALYCKHICLNYFND